jgi:hypothetical protein
MKAKYCFTAQTFDKCKREHFFQFVSELDKLNPVTPWEDLKVGDVYHLPNLLCYKRANLIINEIKRNYLNGMIKEEGSEWKYYSLFKNEIRAKFLIKKIN